jgi:hypothetical protein
MEYSKVSQLKHYKEKRDKVKTTVTVPESALQQQMDDLLEAYQIKFIRIPDVIWAWLQCNASQGVLKFFQKTFGGIPDNVCIVPISKEYNLCLCAELKTEIGKLHGKQKQFEKEVAVQVLRSTQQNIDAINAYKKQIDKCKKCMIDERG